MGGGGGYKILPTQSKNLPTEPENLPTRAEHFGGLGRNETLKRYFDEFEALFICLNKCFLNKSLFTGNHNEFHSI